MIPLTLVAPKVSEIGVGLVPGIIHTWQGPEYGYVTQMTRHFSVAPESPICESGYQLVLCILRNLRVMAAVEVAASL